MSLTEGAGWWRGRLPPSIIDSARPFARRALRPLDVAWWRRQAAVEAENRSAFHLLPFGLMLGILAVYAEGFRPSVPLLLGLGATALAFATSATKPAIRCAFLVLGSVLIGMGSAAFELARNHTVIISGEATTRIEARVLWRDRDERGRWHYVLAIDATTRPTLSRPPTRIELLVSSRHQPLPIGSNYRGLVRLRPPSGPALPDGYDFAEGAYFKGIGAQGFGLGPPEPLQPAEKKVLSIGERLTGLRLQISDRIRDRIGGAEGAVASAIITGERSGIPDDVDAWLRTTGLSHVLSISGLHMALVAGFMMVLVRLGLAAIPSLALHLPSKKIAALAALLGSAFYWALSGMDVATTRSFVMIAIMLTAVLSDRAALTLRNVSIAALIILLTTPHALLTASFQMSFAATAAIVAAYGFHARRRQTRRDDDRRRSPLMLALLSLGGIALTSCVAGLATAPYAAFHFQRVAPFGLLANMLTLPLFSFWIMPLALLAMIAMPFGVDGPLLVALGEGLHLVFRIARFLADRLPDNPSGLLTVAGLIVLTAALLIACFLSSALRLLAIPLGLVGFLLALSRAVPPDLLLFENGREIALIDGASNLQPLSRRPNAFVYQQWQRAYPPAAAANSRSPTPFSCETITADSGSSNSGSGNAKARAMRYCSALTRSGLRVVWTDDYRRTGQACDEADVAIVARAIRLERCRSGARLLTLRSLRRSGSIALYGRGSAVDPVIRKAMPSEVPEWNLHRLAPWPERWIRDGDADKRRSADPSSNQELSVP